jgi:hypothetical protein
MDFCWTECTSQFSVQLGSLTYRPLYPGGGKQTGLASYRKLGGPQSQSETFGEEINLVSQSGFESRIGVSVGIVLRKADL